MVPLPGSVARVREFLREEYARAFRHDHWNIGIVDAPISTFLDANADVTVRWMPSPEPGHYYADPFGIVHQGRTEIFFEDYDFRTDKGTIAHLRETTEGRYSEPRVALDLPFHASFPFLFEHDGSVYCLPETAHGGETALYVATEFPDRWSKAATILPGVAGVDPTLIEHDGRFWLLGTDLSQGPFSQLRIWYARDLLGPWTPHRGNPVKTDPRSARPGGTPFRVGSELYRPAQDCSGAYGGSITINRVERLTTEEYREVPVATVPPFQEGPLTRGIHTLSAVGDRTLVDGKRITFNHSEMGRHFRESLDDRWPRAIRHFGRTSDIRADPPPARGTT